MFHQYFIHKLTVELYTFGMLKVLITGSNGFVGTHLKQLLESSTSPKGKYLIEGFDLSDGQDIRDFEAVRSKIDLWQPDYVFHLAAQAYVPESTMNPRRGIETNLIGTLNVLEAVRQTGMHSRIHIAGTSEEYGYDRDDVELTEESVAKPTTPYGVTKLAATALAMTYAKIYGMKVVCTRAWNHIGPGASPSYAVSAFSKRVAEAEKYGTTIVHGNLDAIRNYTDVRDIVKAYLLAIELDSGIYNLASESTVSTKSVLDNLISYAVTSVKSEENPHLFRPMSNKFPRPNARKFIDATGWTPTVPINKTLLDCLNHWRERV
jgi:GDP-4-dehydro-6-deoxy-D-mannose reductase